MRMNGQSMGSSLTSAATTVNRLCVFITEAKLRYEHPAYCKDCGEDVLLIFEIAAAEPNEQELRRARAKAKTYKCSACLVLMF